MKNKGVTKALLIAVVLLMTVLLAAPLFAGGKKEAPSSGAEAEKKEAPSSGAEAEKQIKIAYVCKMLTHPWFQAEEAEIGRAHV